MPTKTAFEVKSFRKSDLKKIPNELLLTILFKQTFNL